MHSAHRLVILLAFTASGCAGLIYESVWSHYLGLYLGHAAYAQTLTLAIFMGGMTLGAFGISRYIHKIGNALMGYAVAEFVLGIAGLLFHAIYTNFVDFSYATAFPGLENPLLITIYKWTSGALLILPQSIILGSTFPLLCSALIRREGQGIGKHISILYFTNSIGAAVGALLATFMLIPAIGMPGAMLTSGIMNLVIAIVTYYVSKQPEPAVEAEEATDDSDGIELTTIALIAAAITGAVSFMYEIAWIRMLNLVLGTSLHAFEIMLSAFIAGLALGGWWIRNRIDKIPDLLRFTGQVQVFMGLAAISTLALYVESFNWVAALLNEALLRTDTGYFFYNLATSLISGLIMIPATFCAGMTLPLLTTHLIRKRHNENAIGRVYASNTIGAICGIMFAVHIGMTTFGLKWLIIVAGVIDMGLGIYLILHSGRSLKWVSLPSRAIAVCLIGLATLSFMTELTPSRLASGTFRYARAELTDEILFYKDGKTASISVQEISKNSISISTNGKPDAGLRINLGDESDPTLSDEVTMGMAGLIAMLIDPEIKDVANIGFGSGLTSHFLLSIPTLDTLDSIEIEPAMVEGARMFMSRNNLAYDDPRSSIHYDDAKTYFAAQQKKYDAIISEPSNPWVIGVGNLFTLEFYHHIKRYLKDDGVLVQWLQLYEISLPTLLTALNALNEAFGNFDLYATNSGDILIVATTDPNTDLSIKANWQQLPESLRTELEQIDLTSIELVESRKFANKNQIEALVKANNASLNSDYFPLLSLNAPRDRFKNAVSNDLFSLQVLGIYGSPFKNKYLTSGLKPDTNHPFRAELELAEQMNKSLNYENNEEYLDFSDWGMLETLRQPENSCISERAKVLWIQAFNKLAILANSFGTSELRNRFLSFARRFDCVDQLEPTSLALYQATLLSLEEFQFDASDKLRNMLLDIKGAKIHPRYHAFIVSCYLSSLISHPSAIKQEDLQLIAELKGNFTTTNTWLESVLTRLVIASN